MNTEEITYKINGCAMRVHKVLGHGFQEVIYQRCLEIEFRKVGLNYAREADVTIFYDGVEVGLRRTDFVVEDHIIVELKATVDLTDIHLAQAKNYLTAYNFTTGLLINFGARSLQFKRVYNSNPKGNYKGKYVLSSNS